ncbi:hypothetical protein FRB93_008143 [Tulasnella sp. JGI-2019a]|nr:hypothetical protein FRB93_008143 [Tulasnella sp. JGI-2019a]
MSNPQQAPLVVATSVVATVQNGNPYLTLTPAPSFPTQVVQKNSLQPYASISAYVAIMSQNSPDLSTGQDSDAGQNSPIEQIFSMGRPAPMLVATPTSANFLLPSASSSSLTNTGQNQQATPATTTASEKSSFSSPSTEPQPAATGAEMGTAQHVVDATSIELLSETATLTEGLAAVAVQTSIDVVTDQITGPSALAPPRTTAASFSAAEAPSLSAVAASSLSAMTASSISAATASSTSTSASDANTATSTPPSHLPLVIIGSVIGGFVAIAAVSATIGWLLRWRARRRNDYGNDLPWGTEPIFVGDDSKFAPESSPVVHGGSGTSWGNLGAPMGMYESQHGAGRGMSRTSYYGGDGGERRESRAFQYQGTPYPQHNFFPPPGIPLPIPPTQALTSLYGGVVDDLQSPYPYYASPQSLSQSYPADYRTLPTNLSPVTPQNQNLAVTNFAPGDMSHSTTMHTRKSVSSPHQQASTRLLLNTPLPPSTTTPPSPWPPLDVPSRRSTSSSNGSAKRSREAFRTSLPNPSVLVATDGAERESWASALRANFYAALGGIGGAVAVATAAATPRVINDEEKLTPAVPARAMTRRSIPQHQRRRRSSRPQIARGGTTESDPSVYEDDERENDRRVSTQSNRLYGNVQRQSQKEAAQAHRRVDLLLRANSDSSGSSSGWTTDRGETPGRRTASAELAGGNPASDLEAGTDTDWRKNRRV